MPGPGAKGTGMVAIRNYDAWQRVFLNMDTICENLPVDTSLTLFGETYALPVFAGPVGSVEMHYGDKFTVPEYNDILVPACADAGILAFTGDGPDPALFLAGARAIGQNGGRGIPTVKPWDRDTVFARLDAAKASGAKVFAMDIDAAGLPLMKGHTPPAGSKTVAELREIIDYAGVPFLIKGIMTVKGAQKALEAGAAGIVVSNHGGRVLDGVPATADVLPSIADAVKGRMTILVDGGIRTGVDVCKALALGADACILARPYVTAVYGGGAEGVRVLTQKLQAELADTMAMCGVHSLSQITRDLVF
jgi:isopentenyl diphosphate isomerase/L-lactate dehydrogenase-like FMN-dependent dehydrogenase